MSGVRLAGYSTTYPVDFPEGSIAQFSHYLPDVVGINVPVHVLVLFDFLFYLQSWKTKNLTEPGQCHHPSNSLAVYVCL